MPLSDRIRPNSEAAPWVVEEVKKLEAELADLRARFASDRVNRRFFIATKVANNRWIGGEEFPDVESVRTRIRRLHEEQKNLKEDDFLPVEITTVYYPAFA